MTTAPKQLSNRRILTLDAIKIWEINFFLGEKDGGVAMGRVGRTSAVLIVVGVVLSACSSTGSSPVGAKGVSANSTTTRFAPAQISAEDFEPGSSDTQGPENGLPSTADASVPPALPTATRSAVVSPPTISDARTATQPVPAPVEATDTSTEIASAATPAAPAPVTAAAAAPVAMYSTADLARATRHVERFSRAKVPTWSSQARNSGEARSLSFSEFAVVNLAGRNVIPIVENKPPMVRLPVRDGSLRWARAFDLVMTPQACVNARVGATLRRQPGSVASGAGDVMIVCGN